ncbi:MAG: methionine adenosyltransferase [Eubacteriales bacterium]|nr:methionine adenosyltransferase [Eubacteriales bacterium]
MRTELSQTKKNSKHANLAQNIHSIITSESVNIGHPDKTCDVIADAFLDSALSQDPNAQMAVECAIKDNKLFVYGESTTTAKIDYDGIAKQILKDIGYTNDFEIIKQISEQSADINHAVVSDTLCANDQGMVYGYATNETSELMPMPIIIAHKIMQKFDEFRRRTNDFFADAKSQVSIEYSNGKPTRIDTVLISVSHSPRLSHDDIVKIITQNVLNPVLSEYKGLLTNTKYIINPSGRFTIWGSFGDSGCVGRKIVVDTYGGVGRVGGGCFSSKNATKVDRSAAYYARYVAKNIVAHNLADKCEIQVAYAIGLSTPVSYNIDTFGTEKVSLDDIYKFVHENFDFSLSNIISELDLNRPIYQKTACFGHFGRPDFPWEKIKTTITK